MLRSSNNGTTQENGATAREREATTREATRAGVEEAKDNDPMEDIDPQDLIEQLATVDVGDDHSDVLEVVEPYLTSQLLTTYRDPDDRKDLEIGNLALAKRIIKSRDRGRLCTGPFAEVAQDAHRRDDVNVKDRWTGQERAIIRELLINVRTDMQYLGIGGYALDKAADTKVETVTKHIDQEGGGKSRLARAQDKVFGR